MENFGSDEILAQIAPFERKDLFGSQRAFETLTNPDLMRIPTDVASFEHKVKSTRKSGSQQLEFVEHSTEDTTTHNTFQALVERFYRYLEQAHDRASIVRRSKDVYIEMPGQQPEIVGFDFLSILNSDDCVEPVKFGLCTTAKEWLQFAKQIDSINIMGQNFGSLIESAAQDVPNTPQHCSQTSIKPRLDYLIAPISILRTIAQPRTHTLTSVQLTSKLYWHSVDKSFCTCKSPPCGRLRVVKLEPKSASPVKDEQSIKGKHLVFNTHSRGAIIFGQDDCRTQGSDSSSAATSVQSEPSPGTPSSTLSTRTSGSSRSHPFDNLSSLVRGMFNKTKTNDTE
jgi:hypothetical protein